MTAAVACIGRREHAGHAFHFDEARPSLPLPQQFSLLGFFNPLRVAQDHPTTESTGEWHHPAATMLIYLTPPSVGGPTIVLNQTRNSEELAEVGWVVTPAKGMVAVFDGTLLHGALPALTRGATDGRAAQGAKARMSINVAFWVGRECLGTTDMCRHRSEEVGGWDWEAMLPLWEEWERGFAPTAGPRHKLAKGRKGRKQAKQAHAALGAADASLQELVDGAEPPSAMALPEVSPVWAPGSRPPWKR